MSHWRLVWTVAAVTAFSAGGLEMQRVLWVGFYTETTPGHFAFQIDEVRLR